MRMNLLQMENKQNASHPLHKMESHQELIKNRNFPGQ